MKREDTVSPPTQVFFFKRIIVPFVLPIPILIQPILSQLSQILRRHVL